ncbi:MAG: excinuclease ABC subunit UvrB [bacterium]|nr:excinuclease ABC subunit UvrB [bacterium]
MSFQLHSAFQPTGDQPQAIEKLMAGLKSGQKHQTLLGVTGSGKTFTIANVIQQIQRPTLVISHNKTLAAQLYQEFKEFFPKNRVEYFVSYYDYYQPESYIPQTDTYIEKETNINEEIDKLRLAATTSLVTHHDVIIVASVSCIYNLGSPVEYAKQIIELKEGMKITIEDLTSRLHDLHYQRSDYDFSRATYRLKGDTVEIYLAYAEEGLRLSFLGDKLETIIKIDPISGEKTPENDLQSLHETSKVTSIYPAKHYLTAPERIKKGMTSIAADLQIRLKELKDSGHPLEAYRLGQRTNYDLEMIREIGYCTGIENYSRYFDGRQPGEPPFTLLDFFPKDWLCVIDESHMTVPQISGMYNGDRSRKQTLIDYGFRLPSCLDNRPLRFDEFLRRVPQTIYTSATPAEWEVSLGPIVEQLIRPTGLLDPGIDIRPTEHQVNDLITEITARVSRHERVLVTTLTKRLAEDLTDYLKEQDFKVAYLHSDVETLKRTDILRDLRLGTFDVVVGINLLREGLDLPEVSLVAILDADKEGFLRSETSLIQVMGRAARHIQGKAIMYADQVTGSMKRAITEVNRRREIQEQYNQEHHITPQSIVKPIREGLWKPDEAEKAKKKAKESNLVGLSHEDFRFKPQREQKAILKELKQKMLAAAEVLDFEQAAKYRDLIQGLKKPS